LSHVDAFDAGPEGMTRWRDLEHGRPLRWQPAAG
jgi:hypothetical protein